VPLPAGLLKQLACPGADHAALRVDKRGASEVLVCTACESEFPVEDGIPVLLIGEDKPGPRGVGVQV